jgi:hypothetical protein
MQLVTSKNNNCVAASLAMVLGSRCPERVEQDLFCFPREHPFPPPWNHLPMVPNMDLICDWMLTEKSIALTPFTRNPLCSPHPDCPGVSPYNEDPEKVFQAQLNFGIGLLEGVVPKAVGDIGHMCAWDGHAIHDPRGYIYSLNVAEEKFHFTVKRFWLASEIPNAD